MTSGPLQFYHWQKKKKKNSHIQNVINPDIVSFLSFMQILNVYQEPKIRESWYSMFSANPLLTDWHYYTFHYTGHKNTGPTYCWNKLKKLENRCVYFHGIKLWRTRLYCMMKWRLQWPSSDLYSSRV